MVKKIIKSLYFFAAFYLNDTISINFYFVILQFKFSENGMSKKNNKEFIDLLINDVIDNNQRDFVKAFNDFLERMPDFHASGKVKGQGKIKKGEETINWFQPSYILGGIYGFANSKLKETLAVSDVHWKLDESAKVLNLIFKHTNNFYSCRTFIFGDGQVNNPLANYPGKTFRIKPKQSGGGFEIVLEKASDTVELFSKTVLNDLAFNTIDIALERPLEALIHELSLDDLETVKQYSQDFLGEMDLLYQNLLNHIPARNIEAMQHGFFYGLLTFPFKNRFAIDAYVERIAGKGYADLIFIVRGDNPTQAILILIEFKSGKVTILDGLNQIENLGYLEHILSIRTFSKKFVAYSVNLESATELEKFQMYEKNDFPQAKNVIESVIATVVNDSGNKLLQEHQVLNILKYAYFSYYGNHDATHFNRLLLGHLLSLDNKKLNHDKKVFLFDNISDSRRGTFAIVVDQSIEGSNLKNRVILNIIDTNIRSEAKNFIPLSSIDRNNIDKTVQINVEINTGEKNQEAFFENVSIGSATSTGKNYVGKFVSLENIDVKKFISFNLEDSNNLEDSKEVIFDVEAFIEQIAENTFEVKDFLKKEQSHQYNEKDFHALIHGALAGLPAEIEIEGKKILLRIFSEPNLSDAGRIDLALSVAVEQQNVIKQERLYIFELKYASSESEANNILNPKPKSDSKIAKPEKGKQVFKYLINAKSLTDGKVAVVCTVVVCPVTTNKHKFIQFKLDNAKIYHSSAESSPDKRGSKRTYGDSDSSPQADPSYVGDLPEVSIHTPPRKKRKYGCKGKRSGSRPKRDIGVSQGLCVLSTQMQENKKRQQQQFHALKQRLDQASLIIQAAQSGWHIPLSDSPTHDSYLSAISQGFAISVWEDKAAIFLQNLQTTEELAQRAEGDKDWSQQEALQFDQFAEALQTLSALTPNEAVKQTFKLETLTDSLQAQRSDFVWQVTVVKHQIVLYFLDGRYGYFDAQIAWVKAISTVERLVDVFQQGLSVHALTVDSMQIEAISPLETASLFSQSCLELIVTERERLRKQDEQWGPLSLESGTLSREILYDLGLQVPSNEVDFAEKLLDAQTELTSEKFSQLFEDKQLTLLTQDYLKTLQHLKRPSAQQLNYLRASTLLPLQGHNEEKIQVKNAQNVFKHVEPNQALDSVSSYYWQQVLPLETRLAGSSVPNPTLSINQNTGSHTLTNAAGNVLLLKGIADVVQGCRHGDKKDCGEGLLELEFSFFSDAIEKGITKGLQRFKTIQQAKWGKAFGRGVAGVATSLFDIKDFIESLLSFSKAEYGSKTWRDSIAGITLSSLGIASSVILLAAGASGGVGIVVGVVLVLGQGIYHGISWLEEYKKYVLSLDQRIRLFFHGFGSAPPPEDVQHHQARHDYTEKLIEEAQNALKNASEMSFYIGGLGQVKLVEPIKKEAPLKECLNGKEFKRYNSGDKEFAPCMKNIPQPPRLDTAAVTIDMASRFRQWLPGEVGMTIVANHDMPYHPLYKHYHRGSNVVTLCLDNKTKDVALNFNGGIEDQSRYGCKDGFILRRAQALNLICQRAWQTLLPELVRLNAVMRRFINEHTTHQNLEHLSSSTKAQLKNLFDEFTNKLLEKADGLSFYQYKILAARYNRFCDFINYGISGVNEPIIRKILQIEGGDEYPDKMKQWYKIDHWPLFYYNNNLNGKNITGTDFTNKVFDLYINRAPWIPRGENVRDQLLNEFEEKYGFQGWPKIYFRNHNSKYVVGSWSIVNALLEIYENKLKELVGWDEWPLFYFNLNLSNSGSVIGSDVGNNLFDIYQGKDYLIQGGRGSLTSGCDGEPKKRTNYFRLFKSDFFGSLEGGDNTLNVLDVSQLTGSTQVFFDAKINNEGEHLYLIQIKTHLVKTRKINQFIGRKGLFDRVRCYGEALEVPINDPLFFSVDTQGGSATEYDLLFHCQKAVIHPYTLIYPPANREFIYIIKPNKGNTSIYAAINASGAFVFAETDLLSEAKFNYFQRENRLQITIPSKHYSLLIYDFFTKEKTPRYVLRDKGDNQVYPAWPTTLEESVTIQRFLVTGKTTLRTAEAIVANYRALAAKCEDCQVVSDIETDIGEKIVRQAACEDFQDSHEKKLPERFILGSLDSDVIYLQQNQTGETPISYMRGGNGEDLYVLLAKDFKQLQNKPLVIDNDAEDKVLDRLYLSLAKQEIELGINEGDLFLSSQATGIEKTDVRQRMQQFLVLKKYTQSIAHQHLIIEDKNQASYYPLVRQEGGRWFARLIPFYPAQSDSKYSSLSYEELTQEPLIMIPSHFENLRYCRSDNDLLLVEEAPEQKTTTALFTLNLQDFYTHPNAWRELKLYTVHGASCLPFSEIVEQSKLAMNYESFLADQVAKTFTFYRLDLTNPMYARSLAPHQFLNLTQLDLANPMDSDSLATGIAEGEQKLLSLELIANEISKIDLFRGRGGDLLWQFVNDKKQRTVVTVPNWNQKKQRLSLLKYRTALFADIDSYGVDQLSQLQKKLDRHFLLLKFQNALNSEVIDEVPLRIKSALIVSLFPSVWMKESMPQNDENELLAACFGFDSVAAILTFVRTFFKDHQQGVSLLRTFENFEEFKLIMVYLLGQLALTIIREEHISLNDLESCFESFIPQDTIAKLYKLIDDGLGKEYYDHLTSQIERFIYAAARNISLHDEILQRMYLKKKETVILHERMYILPQLLNSIESVDEKVTNGYLAANLPQTVLDNYKGDKTNHLINWYKNLVRRYPNVRKGLVKDPDGSCRWFGSDETDRLIITSLFKYAYGGEGVDEYHIVLDEQKSLSNRTIYIDNWAQDEKGDFVYFPALFEEVEYASLGDNYVLNFPKYNCRLILIHYFNDTGHRHITVKNYQGDIFFPQAYRRSKRALPHNIEKSESIQNGIVYSKQNQQVAWLFPSLSVVGMLLLSTVGYFYIRHLRVRQQRTTLLEAIVTLAPFLNQVGVQAQASQSGIECNEKAFFNNEQCFKIHDTLVSENYVLVMCNNGREFFSWIQDTLSNGDTYLLNYATANLQNVTDDSLSWINITVALNSSYVGFYWNDTCTKILNLEKIPHLKREELLGRLPANLRKYRCRDTVGQWEEAKRSIKTEQALQHRHKQVLQRFYQQVNQIGLNYIGSECLLYTPVGDFFQLLYLQPDWQAKDHSYVSARYLTAASQLLFQTQDPWSQITITTSVLLETAILHPKVKQIYFRLWPEKEFRHGKQAIRLIADLLQFGLCYFAYLPSVLEFLFSDYESIYTLTWGLRAALSFFSLTNDLSYCYLGIGLFLLPQLPILLEHAGIPVTRCVSNILDKLAHFFILNSLLIETEYFKLEVRPDESRLLERQRQLQQAEQRVDKGRQRLLSLVESLLGFFKPTYSHKPDKQRHEFHGVDGVRSVIEPPGLELEYEDLVYLANKVYGFGRYATLFDIVGSGHLLNISNPLECFKKQLNEAGSKQTLTLIVNINQNHWVTCVVTCKDPNKYSAYYVDSLGADRIIPNIIVNSFLSHGIPLRNISTSIAQQKDDYNCGLWALENAMDLNNFLQENKSLDWLKRQLCRPRDAAYFREKRTYLSGSRNNDEHHSILTSGSCEKSRSSMVNNLPLPRGLFFHRPSEVFYSDDNSFCKSNVTFRQLG